MGYDYKKNKKKINDLPTAYNEFARLPLEDLEKAVEEEESISRSAAAEHVLEDRERECDIQSSPLNDD